LSARSAAALETAAANLGEHLALHPDLDPSAVAFTLQAGRRALPHRCAVVYRDVDDLLEALAGGDRRRLTRLLAPRSRAAVALMFSGQGTQYVNMASGLYHNEPTFRTWLDACCDKLALHLDFDLRTVLYPAPADTAAAEQTLTQTAVAQPALFAIEYAL